jgi:DNA-binding MurR/RpiR family transcriptional regulator
MGSAEIVERIKTALDDMPVQMQVAARFIMDQPSEVALLSMREQARKAGVPPATMTRLAQRLGFSGYQDLKDAYVEAVRNNVPWFSGRAVNMLNRRKQIGEAALVTETVNSIARAVEELSRPATVDALIKATNILERARSVYCIGARATFPVAFLFDYTQRFYSDKIHLLEGPGGSGVDRMHRIGSKDALLAVSLSPYSNSTHRATQLAHKAGAKIVAITDSEFAPVARLANVVILVSAQSPSFFDTISPALAAAEVLVALLASRAGADVPKNVSRHEKLLRDAGVFWTPGKRNQTDHE